MDRDREMMSASCTPSTSGASLHQPTFRSSHVYSGHITCQICFMTCDKRHLRRNKYEKIVNVERFKQYALRWETVSHAYNTVYKSVNWTDSAQKWAHKACKGCFLKDEFIEYQPPLANIPVVSECTPAHLPHEVDDTCESTENVRRSMRKKLSYTSSWQADNEKKCIICNENKFAKGRLLPVQTINITDKAEQTLIEYANIHLENQNMKYSDGAKRILLTLSTKSLLAADVAYHKRQCYEPFRSPAWKRVAQTDDKPVATDETNALEDIYQLVLIHIINRGEIYTMAQLKSAYDDILGDRGLSCRSTDLKRKLQTKFGSRLNFQRGTQTHATSSEFVFPEGDKFTASCVQSSLLGGGISKSVSLRNTAKTIHVAIKDTTETRPWPPTPQDIIDGKPYIDTDLYNTLSWIVDPAAELTDDGKVKLPRSKAAKVNQLCQDLQALLPKAQPSLDQVLLSLTMHRKTGSSGVIDTLHGLGYGISYTETVFIEDKWAEWSEKQHSNIPSNISVGKPTTHVADNIDWKNKEIGGTHETHNTNSILIQHKSSDAPSPNNSGTAQVSVTPDYSFKRENHQSFKAEYTELPQYVGKKACFKKIAYEEKESSTTNDCEKAMLETLAWANSRKATDAPLAGQTVPAWSAFRQLTTKEAPPGVNVGYMPAITAPPTDMNVILAILNRSVQCMTELKLDYIFLEADQAIYNKVLQVLFKFDADGSTQFDSVIVRMGGFHIIMCLMKSIYGRFKGSGLVELLSEAGVGAEGTIKAGLSGSNVKQGIRYYKLLFEALLRTKVDYLKRSVSIESTSVTDVGTQESNEGENINDTIETQEHSVLDTTDVSRCGDETPDEVGTGLTCESASMAMHDGRDDQLNVELDEPDTSKQPTLSSVIADLRHEQTADNLETVINHPDMCLPPTLTGNMAKWMDSYIEMVNILLNIIHFQRIGNWEGFLESIHMFLPWCFGLNRHNYARNMSYFYIDMRDLETRNPSAYQYLMDGGFSGSLSGEKHTKIPMDQIIEMTINRCSKETGGLSGKTENVGASARWVRINHYLAALKQHLSDKVTNDTHYKHVELGSKRMEKDELAVERITEGLYAWVPDLWSPSQPLMNIATGIVASDEMVRNVMTTKDRGARAMAEFIGRITGVTDNKQDETQSQQLSISDVPEPMQTSETAHTHKPSLNYHDPIKRQPVLTFENLAETKKKVSIVEDEGRSFAAILAEYDARKLNMRYIMDWPITSKPWAIASESGGIRTSAKSLFRNNLQSISPIPPSPNAPAELECSVVDAMRVVRLVPINDIVPTTFRSWAQRIVAYLRSLPGETIHLVFDDYRPSGGTIYLSKGRPDKGRERNLTDLGQRLPKLSEWNDFLSNDGNKMQITHLLADFILSGESMIGKNVYVTKGSQCMYLAKDSSLPVTEVPDLRSQHREADHRLAYHAVYAASKHSGVCVVADDTDVFVLLLYVSAKCESSLFFRQGTSSSRGGISYHNVKALAENLGDDICKQLPAFHALTGCDYTPPFYGSLKVPMFQEGTKESTNDGTSFQFREYTC